MVGRRVLSAIAAVGVLGVAATACSGNDAEAVDAATARSAIATEDGFAEIVISVSTDGATPEAARILAVAAVRRAPLFAELADRGPDIVPDFVAALVDADAATTGPLVASVVEGLGISLQERLTSYSRLDFDTDAPGVIPPLPVILTIPAGDLNPLALAVATGTKGAEAAPGALLAALARLTEAAEATPEDGALLADLDDEVLLTLGADTASGGPDAVGEALRAALVAFIVADPAVLAAVDPDAPPGIGSEALAERPVVSALLDAVTDPLTPVRGRVSPAGTLALLLTDGET